MTFRENVDPTAAIRAILDSYPFSVGLFRELLQNSDDARASKQVFVLDHRTHPATTLYHPQLAEMQGPALLAYNDALFSDEDWEALQNIHRSSKKTDTSKIGKYGIGFRSCYHVTDGPQILSGTSLALLDPCHEFSPEGGVKFDFLQDSYVDQLLSFDLPRFSQGLCFTGSIIRLPLRTGPSSIGDKRVNPSEIHQLLMDFIGDEIRIALLFLERITSIKVLEIDVHGNTSVLASSEIRRLPKVERPIGIGRSEISTAYTCEVRTITDHTTTEEWRIQHTSSLQSDMISRLSQRAGCDPTSALSEHKLQPDVGIAVPLSIRTQEVKSGRLYTYLPLPLPTGFPVHIHSLFALTQSRQNLRNHEEKGIVRGSSDSILVEWNQLLFDIYIPQAWTYLLTTLIEMDGLSEVFRAWPPAQGHQNGDAGYWKDLPLALLGFVESFCAAIWPVVAPHSGPSSEYLNLRSVAVASPEKPDLDVLQTLAIFGLKITRPPAYIYELLDGNCMKLTPKSAYGILLKHVPELELRSNVLFLPVILRYLLADNDLTNLVGLPLIFLANGQRVSLNLDGSPITHTMLEKNEFEIFGTCDNDLILLHLLDEFTARILRNCGPDILNVQPLLPETIVQYLKMHPNPFGLVLETKNVNYSVVEWLSRFWTWMGSWQLRDELYPLIRDLPLLPSKSGLRRTSTSIYTQVGVHPILVSSFNELGISFLHPSFSSPVQQVVSSFRRLGDLNDASDLLDSLDFNHVGTVQLDKEAARTVLRHFVQARKSMLPYKQQQKLRKVPIFPLVPAGSRNAPTFWGCIPDAVQVRGVYMGNLPMLPVLQDTVFVDGSIVDSSFLKILDPSSCNPLSEHELLVMAIKHFTTQSVQTKVAFVEYMAKHRDKIPPVALKSLRQTPFVVVTDGSLQVPDVVVDPKSDIAQLFLSTDNRFPRMTDNHQEMLIKNLQLLHVMQDTLTIDIVNERIQFISELSTTSFDIASLTMVSRHLLRLLYRSGFNCANLRVDPNLKWLPTQRGLLSPAGCRDEGSHQRKLFDHVLPLLDNDIAISPSLKVALGWDKPLPFEILVQQLSKVLDLQHDDAYAKIEVLIKELSQHLRDLDEGHFCRLHTVVDDQSWVPVSSGKLADTWHAVFSGSSPRVGFHEIPFPFTQGNCRAFLSRMGCSEKPLLPAITRDLKLYQKLSPTNDTAEKAILLLKSLPPDISTELRQEIVVPDSRNNLLSLDSIYYNDIGNRAQFLICSNSDIHIAHPALHEHLATMLHMNFLGLAFSQWKGLRRRIGERPTTTIRNRLSEYTKRQFLTEFLANAADAQATEFGIFIDEHQNSGGKTLSRKMDKFQACPSLIIYNNATFTEKDFDGICNSGNGGKRERTDSIGQFGYGALTMFHFSEVITIVSGDRVMLLNPSQDQLPDEHSVEDLSLDSVNILYPDQLASLDGVFQFKKLSSFYNGTIFRLPLRNKSHIGGNPISRTTWTARTIEDDIIRPFLQDAHEFLLFTNLQTIKFHRRDVTGTTSKEERFSATRQDEYVDGTYRSEIMHFHPPPNDASGGQKWNVVSKYVPRKDCSSTLPGEYRLRSPIVAGIAARLDHDAPHALGGKFFSTLPLPVSNALPVHITAPFLLSPDRRQIRFDVYDASESEYNQWLLESVIPPLYVFLLADLLRRHGHNKWWWPGTAEERSTHKINETLVSAFYKVHLGKTGLCVFLPKYAVQPVRLLIPKEAIIMEPGSPAVLKKVLEILKPPQLASLPNRLRSRAIRSAGIGSVTPLFIKSEVLRCANSLASGLTIRELHELIEFIRKNDTRDLVDLPLLPLADGTFAKFENGSSCTAMYVLWKPRQASEPLFLQHHLVHPEFCATKFVDLGLNITKLSVIEIQRLVQEIIPRADERSEMSLSKQQWIDRFWSEYPLCRGNDTGLLECISHFPFVRTMQQGRYVSISQCRNQSSVILSSAVNLKSELLECLSNLGLTVVNRSSEDLPHALRKILLLPSSAPGGFSDFQFDHLLLILRSSESVVNGLSIAQRFRRLNADDHQIIARWARSQICNTSKNLLPIARKLPIWSPIQRLSQPSIFLPAEDITEMLPIDVTSALVMPFINSGSLVMKYSEDLLHLDLHPMPWSEFFGKLHFPNYILPLRDMPRYGQLLRTIVGRDRDISWVLVPNCNNVMCHSDSLYARDPLFLAALGSGSRHFVVESFRDLKPWLKANFGLKCQNQLDLAMFRECASAIDDLDDLSDDMVQRAGVIFQTYCQDLPLRIAPEDSWQSLNNLKFIPRVNGRHRWNTDVSAYVKNRDLPDLVAPKDIVLRKYEAVAWTQRVLSIVEPSLRILLANPNFGIPTAEEVVRHLDRLARQVMPRYPQNRDVLQDLRETYAWLDEHAGDARVYMIQHHAHKLFLNVADPEEMTWEWHSAEDLLIGAKETMRNFHPVQKFLLSFKNLLEVSGVQRLMDATLPERTSDDGSQISLQSIRSMFCVMREERQLTDVIFIPEAEDGEPETFFYAHRAYLASCCDHFKDSFTSAYEESQVAPKDFPVRVDVKYSSRCVQIVLDYLYKGVVDSDVTTLDIGELLEVMELSNYWGITSLHGKVQYDIIPEIDPQTVTKIEKRAADAQAHDVVEKCKKYREDNRAIIEQVCNYEDDQIVI